MTILRIFGYIVFVFFISAIISYIASSAALDLINRGIKTITPENVAEIKDTLRNNDIVKISGTVNFLYLVKDEDSPNFYFAGLKEFGEEFIIKIRADKLILNKQEFTGKVVQLSNDSFSERLVNAINAPLDFSDEQNKQLKDQLNEAARKKITESSRGDFTDLSILILDGEVVNKDQIYTNIIIVFGITSIFLLTLFRKKIFKLNKKKKVEMNRFTRS